MKWLWGKLNGWKRILTYSLANIPWLGGNPLAIEAIEKAVTNPSKENLINAGIHVGLALATFHGLVKKVRGE